MTDKKAENKKPIKEEKKASIFASIPEDIAARMTDLDLKIFETIKSFIDKGQAKVPANELLFYAGVVLYSNFNGYSRVFAQYINPKNIKKCRELLGAMYSLYTDYAALALPESSHKTLCEVPTCLKKTKGAQNDN